jgi:uncharacterized protein YecT (DUF1311 family)
MFIKLVFGFVLLAAVTVTANAQADEKHPIDATLGQCLKIHHGTMPRAKCYSDASVSWQTEVKDTYAELLKLLPAESRTTLEKSQAAWEKYQAGEAELITKIYFRQKGTMYISVRIIELMKPFKDRALELESHLRTIKYLTNKN